MRLLGINHDYDRVPNVEAPVVPGGVSDDIENLPLEPPQYENVSAEENNSMQQMDMQDIQNNERLVAKMYRFRDSISNNVIGPVREKIMDPLAQLLGMISDKIDFYLNKVGNPLILRRFFYIFMMSAVTYMVMASGFIPNERSSGYKGMFSDHDVLLQYSKYSIDLSKFERDLEYISSMPHMSGTKGDSAIRQFVKETMDTNRLGLVTENEYLSYASYPEDLSLTALKDDVEYKLNVTEENFNPLGISGEISGATLIYGHMGTFEELQMLKDNGLLEGDFVIMVHYGKLVSEQILLAEKFGAKGLIFITEPYNDDGDVIQKKSVGIPQYWTGDPSRPGFYDPELESADFGIKDSKSLSKIPSIPLSWNQAQSLLGLLSNGGVTFEKSHPSGKPGDVYIEMKVKMAVREQHPLHDILGKIEGREQNDKAIVIAASRTSASNGATYPAFGTALLLSLVQLFQELKYKYDWKPLRNIYFVSFGGTEFNFVGSSELVKQRISVLKDEVYSLLDISQLGIGSDDKKIHVQAHPLLHQFFRDENDKIGFDVSVKHVSQYGDWTPFMANGIPVSVLSTSDIEDFHPPIETSQDVFESVDKLLENADKHELVSNLLLYILQSSLKLVDEPFIPYDILEYVHYVNDLLEELKGKYSTLLNFEEIIKALSTWKNIGEEWHAWNKSWQNIVFSREEGMEPSLISVHRWTWNKKLSNIGRRQCFPAGLPDRPFYKNILFGPTFWTQEEGEDSWSFPGVRDAIKDKDWKRAQQEVDIVAKALEQSAALFLEETTDVGN